MSVRRAQAEINSREFSDWHAFRRMEDDPDDIRAARICQQIALLGGNKRARLADFMPARSRPRQTGRQIKAAMRAFGGAHNRRMRAAAAKKRRRQPNG